MAEKKTYVDEKKVPLVSPLARPERVALDYFVVRIPPWIESYHLTLVTIPLTCGMILFGLLANRTALAIVENLGLDNSLFK